MHDYLDMSIPRSDSNFLNHSKILKVNASINELLKPVLSLLGLLIVKTFSQ